ERRTVVVGTGEDAPAAQADALRKAQQWIERELTERKGPERKAALKPGELVPLRCLTRAYLERHGVIDFKGAAPPAQDPNAAAWRQSYEVTVGADYVAAVRKVAGETVVIHGYGQTPDGARANALREA